ncbi:MAG: methyltransferase domain-containing protein [Proteobacteria bacterium]|nr:methyltransferase domain-containing protein [Pseudomonadota bacterium]
MKQKQDIFSVLDGRVRLARGAYNPTADAVFLAAFVNSVGRAGPARRCHSREGGNGGQSLAALPTRILDVGIGSGGAALALLARIPGAIVTGIDVSEQLLTECAANAALNDRDIELIHADIMTWKTGRTFDAVMTNPPYFRGTPRKSTDRAPQKSEIFVGGVNRAQSTNNSHHNVDLYKWVRMCLKRVRPLGYFYCIVDTAMIGDIIAAIVTGKGGDIEIVPLFGNCPPTASPLRGSATPPKGGVMAESERLPPWGESASTSGNAAPREPVGGQPAERVLISARLGAHGGTKIYSGASMNDDRILRDMGTVLE